MNCPLCGGKNTLVLRKTIYRIPLQGETILVSGKCHRCGYRFTWSVPLYSGKSRTIEIKVSREKDLNILVFIGENSEIEIPEAGARIYYGDDNPGFVTTIEGLLMRVRDYASSHCESDCDSILGRIDALLTLSRPFRIVIHDKEGRSLIDSPKATVKENNDRSR